MNTINTCVIYLYKFCPFKLKSHFTTVLATYPTKTFTLIKDFMNT